jgi:competence protein ComEC
MDQLMRLSPSPGTQAVVWVPGAEPLAWSSAAGMLLIPFWWLAGAPAAATCLFAALSLLQADAGMKDRLPVELQGRDLLVSGFVSGFPTHSRRSTGFMFDVVPNALTPGMPERLWLNWYETEQRVSAGDCLELLVRLRRPRSLLNPGGRDRERAALVSGVGARGYVRNSSINGGLSGNCSLLLRWRSHLVERMTAGLGDSAVAAYAVGIVFGARHELAAQDWQPFRDTGTAHLLAISGLHIGLVFGWCMFAGNLAAKRLRKGSLRHAGIAIGLTGAAVYTVASGLGLPAVRAFVMAAVYGAATVFGYGNTPVRSLAVAMLFILVFSPLQVLGAGFWLSFGAVTILLTAGGQAPDPDGSDGAVQVSVRHKALRLVHAQLVLTAGLVPVGVMAFGGVPAMSLLLNLAAIPFFSLIVLPALLVFAVLAVFVPAFALLHGRWLVMPLDWLVAGLARASEVLPGFHFVATPAGITAVLLVAGAVLVLIPWAGALRITAAAVLASLILRSAPQFNESEFGVVVLDVGHGLATLAVTRHYALVFDGGPQWNSSDAGSAVLLPAARALGIPPIADVVLSHTDRDHAGGIHAVVREWPDAVVWAPGSTIPGLPITVRSCRSGFAWQRDGVRFRLLQPYPDARGDNDGSCVLVIDSKHGSVVLPGDLEMPGEARLVELEAPQGPGLVVAPHHGSGTSSGSDFIQWARARFVSVSAAYGNRWNLPSSTVVERWRTAGACVHNTAHTGAQHWVATREHGVTLLKAWRRQPAPLWREYPISVGECRPRAAIMSRHSARD